MSDANNLDVAIGIDNGVSAPIAILVPNERPVYFKIPTCKEPSYAKKRQEITRIDRKALIEKLRPYVGRAFALIEYPMTNNRRFQASLSNHRSWEAVKIVLEDLGIGFANITPGEWQKHFLSKKLRKEADKKVAAVGKAIEIWPFLEEEIMDMGKGSKKGGTDKKTDTRIGDADGLLIALYAKKMYL